jgi:multiple sugar transport system substrate-binding protein
MKIFRWLLIAGAMLAAPAVIAQAKVELEFPSWQAEEPGLDKFWREAVKAFEASHPNVHINLYQVPFKEYIDKLTVRFASNNPPQIVQLPTRNLPSFASQGWLSPLDDMIAKTDIKATYTSMSEEMVWDNKTVGVLLLAYGMMFYYNDQILQDAGVKVPTSQAELLKAIQATTNAGKGVFGWAATTNEHPNVYVDWASWATGEGVSFYKNGQYNFTDPAVVASIDRFRQAVKNAPKGVSTESARQLFIDGKIAMMRDGPWFTASLKNASDPVRSHLKVGLLPFANNPGGTSNSIHIPAKIDAERKQLVWEFIQMISTPEWQSKYALLTEAPAPRRNAVSEKDLAANPNLALAMKSAATAKNIFPDVPAARTNYNQIAKLVSEAGVRMINSDKPTDAILKDLQSELERRAPLK